MCRMTSSYIFSICGCHFAVLLFKICIENCGSKKVFLELQVPSAFHYSCLLESVVYVQFELLSLVCFIKNAGQ